MVAHEDMLAFCAVHGFDARPACPPDVAVPAAPFVYVFGRSLSTVSVFGANVYPENVAVALERPGSLEELGTISGIGETKLATHGEGVLAAVAGEDDPA